MRNLLLPSSLLLLVVVLVVDYPQATTSFSLPLPSSIKLLTTTNQNHIAFSTHLSSSSSTSTTTTTSSTSSSSTSSSTSSISSTSPILSDIDMMCITNAAELCTHYQNSYDECDIEQREAFLNRLDDQIEIMAERLAMLSSVKKHITAPSSSGEDEVEDGFSDSDSDSDSGMEVDFIKEEILNIVGTSTGGADKTLLGP